MWKDDKLEMLEIFDLLQRKTIKFPANCPCCGQLAAHAMFYCYNQVNRRGGFWVWCSKCKQYVHTSVKVPNWWKNIADIQVEDLVSEPVVQENSK